MEKECTNGSLCPKCKHHLVAQAVRCSNCGALVEEARAEAKKALAESAGEVAGEGAGEAGGTSGSNFLPLWKYCLLLFLTFGLYEVWWFYRTWAFVRRASDVKGVWKNIGSTIGCAIPIVNLFFLWKLLASVRNIASTNNLPARFSVATLFVVYQMLGVARYVVDYCFRDTKGNTGPEIVGIFCFSLSLTLIPMFLLFLVQRTCNDYLEQVEKLPPSNKVRGGEIAIFVVGGAFWALILLALVLVGTGKIDMNGKQLKSEAPAASLWCMVSPAVLAPPAGQWQGLPGL